MKLPLLRPEHSYSCLGACVSDFSSHKRVNEPIRNVCSVRGIETWDFVFNSTFYRNL